MLEVKNLKCEYRNGQNIQTLFKDVNFTINQGDFVIITGPSGSGKTSLLNIISGLQKPTIGNVYINGIDLYKLSDNELSEFRLLKSGFIYQDFMLIDELNAYDNIILPMEMANLKNKEYVSNLINKLKIFDLVKKEPSKLSGGQKQKVCIARSLVNKPLILFCDEPTGSLDHISTKEVMEILSQLNKEEQITIVMVTHELELLSYANKIIKYDNGQIICE